MALRGLLLELRRLPAPGVADDFDDVAVVFVDQIDRVVDVDPPRARRRIAQAVGAPVIHLIRRLNRSVSLASSARAR